MMATLHKDNDNDNDNDVLCDHIFYKDDAVVLSTNNDSILTLLELLY